METSSKVNAARMMGVSLETTATSRSQGQDRVRSTGRTGEKIG